MAKRDSSGFWGDLLILIVVLVGGYFLLIVLAKVLSNSSQGITGLGASLGGSGSTSGGTSGGALTGLGATLASLVQSGQQALFNTPTSSPSDTSLLPSVDSPSGTSMSDFLNSLAYDPFTSTDDSADFGDLIPGLSADAFDPSSAGSDSGLDMSISDSLGGADYDSLFGD